MGFKGGERKVLTPSGPEYLPSLTALRVSSAMSDPKSQNSRVMPNLAIEVSGIWDPWQSTFIINGSLNEGIDFHEGGVFMYGTHMIYWAPTFLGTFHSFQLNPPYHPWRQFRWGHGHRLGEVEGIVSLLLPSHGNWLRIWWERPFQGLSALASHCLLEVPTRMI